MRATELTGDRFGRWIVVSREENHRRGWTRWLVRCDCGNEKILTASVLKTGKSTSCGCYQREWTIAKHTKHGHDAAGAATPTYQTWGSMIKRCTNPNDKRYADWGGRGIKVCDRWRDFRNFLADMGKKPEGTSIDRINNDGDYEPGNCRWATPSEQNFNRRRPPPGLKRNRKRYQPVRVA